MGLLGTVGPVSAAEKQSSPVEFSHEEHGVPDFAVLLKEYDYDEYVKKADGEFR